MVLYGWYGGGNLGDEAVLAGIVQLLRERDPDVSITALAVNPTQTARLHGIAAVARQPFKARAAIKRCDTFALGGGGTVQDVTSIFNLPSFLLYPMLAARMGKRVVWCGVGVGPLGTRLGRWLARLAARSAQSITVRDQLSATLLRRLGLPSTPSLTITADPALCLTPAPIATALKVLQNSSIYIDEGEIAAGRDKSRSYSNALNSNLKPQTSNLVVFALRRPLDPLLGKGWRLGYLLPVSVRERWGRWSAAAERLYTDTCNALAQLADYCVAAWGAEALFIPFDAVDRKVATAVMARMQHPQHAHQLEGEHHPATVMAVIGQADMVVAMRLHGLILGAAMGRPLLALSYDHKVRSFMQRLDAEQWCLPVDSNAAQLQARAAELWAERDAVAATIRAKASALKERARLNADIFGIGRRAVG